jgi:hypothetical protein
VVSGILLKIYIKDNLKKILNREEENKFTEMEIIMKDNSIKV